MQDRQRQNARSLLSLVAIVTYPCFKRLTVRPFLWASGVKCFENVSFVSAHSAGPEPFVLWIILQEVRFPTALLVHIVYAHQITLLDSFWMTNREWRVFNDLVQTPPDTSAVSE